MNFNLLLKNKKNINYNKKPTSILTVLFYLFIFIALFALSDLLFVNKDVNKYNEHFYKRKVVPKTSLTNDILDLNSDINLSINIVNNIKHRNNVNKAFNELKTEFDLLIAMREKAKAINNIKRKEKIHDAIKKESIKKMENILLDGIYY